MLRRHAQVQEVAVRGCIGRVVQVCEVIACGDAHPWVAGSLAALVALAAREAEGAVDGPVVELGEARGTAGEVVGSVGRQQAVGAVIVRPPKPMEGSGGQRALVLHREFLLYQVGKGLPGDVKGVKAQVIVLLLLGGGAKAEGCLPICGGGHWYCV